MTSGSEVMCRKKVDTPWSIYRVFTVSYSLKISLNFKFITNKKKQHLPHHHRKQQRGLGRTFNRRPLVQPGPLPVRRLPQVLLNLRRPEQAQAVPLRRPGAEALHLQVLRQDVHVPRRPQDAHPHAHPALQVQDLRQVLLAALAPPRPRAHPHGREALQVRHLCARLRRQIESARPHADAQRRQEVQVPQVSQDLFAHVAAQQARGWLWHLTAVWEPQ